jgi:hypothetical protein
MNLMNHGLERGELSAVCSSRVSRPRTSLKPIRRTASGWKHVFNPGFRLKGIASSLKVVHPDSGYSPVVFGYKDGRRWGFVMLAAGPYISVSDIAD